MFFLKLIILSKIIVKSLLEYIYKIRYATYNKLIKVHLKSYLKIYLKRRDFYEGKN